MGHAQAISRELLQDRHGGWRGMVRIESVGGDVNDVIAAERMYLPERLVYAEGDSWFDKFTPVPATGTNLLDAIRTPFFTAVVDAARIGDEANEMVAGSQGRQTRAMFDMFVFDAILLSAGGNDLKNLFAERFRQRALAQGDAPWSKAELDQLADPASYKDDFNGVIASIVKFIGLRDAGRKTRHTPILVNGYDYLQPRPAGAVIFSGTKLGRGPWLHPVMKAAGLTPEEMRTAADAVVDELNKHLHAMCDSKAGVQLIDQRGLLQPARAETTGTDADWMDEIHPNEKGFEKLARNGWDLPLAVALGWHARPQDLADADLHANASTARPLLA
jgi:hypothetical protein